MKRAVSYSDSFLYLPSIRDTPNLEPLLVYVQQPIQGIQPIKQKKQKQRNQHNQHKKQNQGQIQEHEIIHVYTKPGDVLISWFDTGVFFVIKGSLHIFFISTFETIFYFLYVSRSENGGIMNTINTYYMPLIQSCDTWSNTTRTLFLELLEHELNKTIIDTKGVVAANARQAYNESLLYWSITYSGICLAIFVTMIGVVYWKKIHVNWVRLFAENMAFVTLLGMYEFFFFKTIIYNYKTISTDELNQYIVDDAFQCLKS